MGSRPRIDIDLEKVRKYAALGLTQEQIAAALGICEATFYKYKAQNAEFAEAVKKGQSEGIAVMASRLLEQSKGGSVAATIFYLKCHGWKEANTLEVTNSKGASGMKDFYSELNENLKKIDE